MEEEEGRGRGGGRRVERGVEAVRDNVRAWEGRGVSCFATEGGGVGERWWGAPFHTERARSARVGSIVDAGVVLKTSFGVLRKVWAWRLEDALATAD